MKITVHGNTHLAWVTAAKLAEKGNHLTLCLREQGNEAGFDPTREWLLSELVAEQQLTGRLQVNEQCGGGGRIHLLAANYDESTLREAIQPALLGGQNETIILVLTALPIGLLESIQKELDGRNAQMERRIYLAALPLFVREGTALADFEKPQLLLLGSEDKPVIDAVEEFMRPFMRQAEEVMVVPITTAELIKIGIHAMLATRISFMNEMAALAEKLNVDIELVRQGIAADPRVGKGYLQAGCGFGGSSFSNDLLSIAKTFKQELDASGLVDAVLAINESQKDILFRKIWRFYRGKLSGKTVAVWGAAFKPGTSSVTNSVVHALLQSLWAQGCRTQVYDPQAREALHEAYPNEPLLTLSDTAAQAAEGSDAIAVVTEWDEFWGQDFSEIAKTMRCAALFDGRNIYEAEQMQALGFRYFGIGRGERI